MCMRGAGVLPDVISVGVWPDVISVTEKLDSTFSVTAIFSCGNMPRGSL